MNKLNPMEKNELVDLVDASGVIIKTAIPRSEAEVLNGEKLHIPIIGCVVLNDIGEVLVHERAKGKRFAGSLDNVYGAIASGETPEHAAERECGEELGIAVAKITRVGEFVNKFNYYQYLFAVSTADIPTKISKREVAWARYMPVEELRAGRDDGSLSFTHNFFTDLEAVLTKLDTSNT
jgi:mutator protein MutT